jgi:hypothetical protein
MTAYQPYKDNYYSKKKKTTILVAILSITALVVSILLISSFNKEPEPVKVESQKQREDTPSVLQSTTGENQTRPGNRQEQVEANITNNRELEPETDLLSTESGPEKKAPLINRSKTENNNSNSNITGDEWVSDVDIKREQGLGVFEESIQQCWNNRERLNQLQAEYDANCLGTSFDAFGNPIINASTPQCRKLMSTINTLRSQMKKDLEQAKYRARKAGLYPGQIRDILEKYQFQE